METQTETFLPENEEQEIPDLRQPESATLIMREIRYLQGEIDRISDSFQAEIDRLKALQEDRQAAPTARLEQLKLAIRRYMADNEIKKLDNAIGIVNLKPGAISVNLADDIEAAVEILEAYAPETVCTVPKIDKVQVKKALLDGRIPNNTAVYTTQGEPILAVRFH